MPLLGWVVVFAATDKNLPNRLGIINRTYLKRIYSKGMESERLKRIKSSLKTKIGRERLRTALQFVPFLLISAAFWLFVTTDEHYQQEVAIPLEITSIPDSVTMISEVPPMVKVSVNEKGTKMLKYLFGRVPTLTIDFRDYVISGSVLRVSATDMRSETRKVFSQEANVISVSPDSLRLIYTSLAPKRVPVKEVLDVEPNLQYVIVGGVTKDVDSVLVYGDSQTLSDITEVRTERIIARDLTETLRCEAAMEAIPGARIEPKSVTLTIPVEQLIGKRQEVNIRVDNCPEYINVLTFPAVVEASFLVPQSVYNKEFDISAAVDFYDISTALGSHVPVRVAEYPAICRSVSLAMDSVEFLIER